MRQVKANMFSKMPHRTIETIVSILWLLGCSLDRGSILDILYTGTSSWPSSIVSAIFSIGDSICSSSIGLTGIGGRGSIFAYNNYYEDKPKQ